MRSNGVTARDSELGGGVRPRASWGVTAAVYARLPAWVPRAREFLSRFFCAISESARTSPAQLMCQLELVPERVGVARFYQRCRGCLFARPTVGLEAPHLSALRPTARHLRQPTQATVSRVAANDHQPPDAGAWRRTRRGRGSRAHDVQGTRRLATVASISPSTCVRPRDRV